MPTVQELNRKFRTPPYNPPKQCGIPVILVSSGTMGNNGALSAITNLPTTYSSCYVYLPANAISAGSAAALKYAVMATVSSGTVYDNTYDPTTGEFPTIPSSPTAFATTGPGAYTQTTASDINLHGINVHGGAMGASGSVESDVLFLVNTSASNKITKVKYGGTAFSSITVTTTNLTQRHLKALTNRGVTNKQVADVVYAMVFGSTTIADVVYTSVDSTATQTVLTTGQLALATDFIVCERAKITVNFSAG